MRTLTGSLQVEVQLAKCTLEVTTCCCLTHEMARSSLYRNMRAGQCQLLVQSHPMQVRVWQCLTMAWQPKGLS